MDPQTPEDPTGAADTGAPLHFGIYGAPLDTGNLGVSALGISSVRGLLNAHPAARITLFNMSGRSHRRQIVAEGMRADIDVAPSSYSRRFWRGSNLQQAWLAARLGLGALHPYVRRLRSFDAVLDISGGDSFADLYGAWRFRAITLPKRLALRTTRRLVLLPQTYGPFEDLRHRREAADLLRGASQVWARDARSLAVVRELLAEQFDPQRHRSGVDVAFGLPSRPPEDRAAADRVTALRREAPLLLGLNVSGLLFFADEGPAAFGLNESYRDVVVEVARALLERPDARLLLVPHVTTHCHEYEDDARACHALRERLGADLQQRVLVAPSPADPMEAKWLVGQCDWFCGSRMHSCIAGLSQAIPTVTMAYSDKSLGVFETVGAGDMVLDLRTTAVRELVPRILASVSQRVERAAALEDARARVQAKWREQFRSIVSCVRDLPLPPQRGVAAGRAD